jgi:hypothetical protein
MGYHLRTITKRQVGTIEKVLEEVEEYQDAMEQGCEIMALVELSDIYGALQLVVEKHNKTMEDLKAMATVTRRAFEDGSRKSSESSPPKTVIYGDVYEGDVISQRPKSEIEAIETIVAEFNAYDKDLRFDMNSNTVDVSVVHLPTGLIANCNQYPNLLANKKHALLNLAVLLYDHRQSEKIQDIKKRFKETLKAPGVPLIMPHTSYGCGCGRGNDCCLVKEHITNKFG